MARGFKRTRKGIVGRFEGPEVRLLQKLFSDVGETLAPEPREKAGEDEDPLEALLGWDQEVPEPTDPALRRMLPAASSDPEQAAEFRRLTDRSLRERKVAALRASSLVLEAEPVVLSTEQAQDFARSLNDVRLVLAARLGIDTPQDAERVGELTDFGRAETVEEYMAVVYNFVSWLQETLMDALLKTLPSA
ncbi:DUF2017 domain-containing protein [Kocuria sp.]|uniref:DUF2017 domain-containing protein n=1 Tax=Kocuria sp. TaxID=1871328 RepID=UPI0026DB577E|nr:DUF2017 domain-containing protein [Kocuria sp.]MDO4918559.1 DUF2017 domain-containing protein [Kocuria sp.]